MLLAIRAAFEERLEKRWLEALADSQEEADAVYNESLARRQLDKQTEHLGL